MLPLSKFKSMVPIFIKYHQQFSIEKSYTYYLSPWKLQKTKPYQTQTQKSSRNRSDPIARPRKSFILKENFKNLRTNPLNTVEVISVTDKPFFFRKRWRKDSVFLFFFWVLAELPESSMSGSVRPEKVLLERTVIDWIDLAWLWKLRSGEQIALAFAGTEAKAKAASSRAISSSLTISISIGISEETVLLLLRGNSESDSVSLILWVSASAWGTYRWNRHALGASHRPVLSCRLVFYTFICLCFDFNFEFHRGWPCVCNTYTSTLRRGLASRQ